MFNYHHTNDIQVINIEESRDKNVMTFIVHLSNGEIVTRRVEIIYTHEDTHLSARALSKKTKKPGIRKHNGSVAWSI